MQNIFEDYINMSSRFESLFRHSCRKWCSLRRNFYRFRYLNVLFSSLLQEKTGFITTRIYETFLAILESQHNGCCGIEEKKR